MKKQFLAVIPARGGSKGIPGKNIKLLNGKPLIAYTIEAALQSNCFMEEDVICSTDSPEIADVATSLGASVPFFRPPELAGDRTSTVEVIEHLLENFEQENIHPEQLVLLQPTSPFRTAVHIQQAVLFFLNNKADALVSVAPVRESPFWMKTLNDSGIISNLLPGDTFYEQRQQLPQIYKPNGAIYIIKTTVFKSERSFYPSGCYGFVMDRKSSVDIDDELDWLLAESLVKM